jgi:hypothetical protein
VGGPGEVACSPYEIDDKYVKNIVLNPKGKRLLWED